MHPWWSWNRERERIRSAHGTSISVKKRKGRKVTAVVVAGGPGPGGTPPARGSSAKYLPTSRQRKSTPRCHLAMQGGKKVHRGSDVCTLGTSSSCSLGRKRSSTVQVPLADILGLGHSSSHQCPLGTSSKWQWPCSAGRTGNATTTHQRVRALRTITTPLLSLAALYIYMHGNGTPGPSRDRKTTSPVVVRRRRD